jgi:hypothetical protein
VSNRRPAAAADTAGATDGLATPAAPRPRRVVKLTMRAALNKEACDMLLKNTQARAVGP